MDLNHFYRNYWLLCLAGAIFLVVNALGVIYWHCPIHAMGLPCMGCGITRGLLELGRFHIKAAFSYNPLALPIALAWFASMVVALFDLITGRQVLKRLYMRAQSIYRD